MQIRILLATTFFISAAGLYAQNDYDTALSTCQKLDLFESQTCMVGAEIPTFSTTAYDGSIVNNASVSNQVAVLHFWFMACPPCIAEMDGLNRVVDRYKNRDDVSFLAFTTDSRGIIAEEFFTEHNFAFTIIPDAMDIIIDVFQMRWGFPTTIVVDKSGQIFRIFSGGSTDDEKASAEVEATLVELIDACLE